MTSKAGFRGRLGAIAKAFGRLLLCYIDGVQLLASGLGGSINTAF